MNSENKEKLIENVRLYECLYNVKNKDYKNVSYKNLLWEKIGAAIGVQGSKAKDTWRTLRDGYLRHKKTVKGQTGSGRKYSNFTWSSQMAFLDGTLELRATSTNVTPMQEISNVLPSPASTSPEPTESSPTSLPQQQDHTITTRSSQSTSNTGLEETLAYLHNLTNSSSSSSTSSIPSSPPSTQTHPLPSTSTSTPRAMKRKNNTDTGLDNTDRVIEYLKSKKKKEWDSIDYLFMSYAKSFKQLSIRQQSKIKIALAKLFADAELEREEEKENIQPGSVMYLSPAYAMTSEDLAELTSPAHLNESEELGLTSTAVDVAEETIEVVDLSNHY